MSDNVRIAELLEMLAKEMKGDELVTKTPANFSNYSPLHGVGGILSNAALERDIVTGHMRPMAGIGSRLTLIPSIYLDPRFGSITGFTATSGEQPAYACQDAPIGYIKGCNLTARFGRKRMDTNTIDVDDVMLRLHRGEHSDFMLRGKLLGMTDFYPSGLSESAGLNVVTMSEMVIAAVNMERLLAREIWQGVVTVANEFPGLDAQIATGQQDADTGVTCPALDSDVKNFGFNLVSGNTLDIVEYLASMMWYLNDVADGTGLAPVQWVIAMRAGLWRELTEIWPCKYHTNKCAAAMTDANAQVTVDGTAMTAARNDLRRRMVLEIDGVEYPVVLDNGIFEHTNVNNANVPAGSFASSIYVVPLTASGGWPTTYREYVDYRKASADVALLNGMNQFFWSDNGVWSWAYEQIKWCYKLSLKTEQRVILRTPHLAGRIDAVRYAPLQHERERLDPAGAYFMDGGSSLLTGTFTETPYAAWTSR